jgi:HK97 family phage portal protein
VGLLARLFGERKSDDPTLREAQIRGGLPVDGSGVRVTAETALRVSTVLACGRVIANGMSQVPFRLFLGDEGSRKPAVDHPLYRLLTRKPNKWQTIVEFMETIAFHLLFTGNAIVFVNKVGISRTIIEMVPIEPKRVDIKLKPDQSLEYRITAENGSSAVFGADSIWHLRGPSWNGWLGLDTIRLAAEAIGLAISLEKGQFDFQRNGAQTSGSFAVQEKLSPERFAFLSSWIDKHLPGGERSGKPLVLDNGAVYEPHTMTGVDQQLLETRRNQVEEICRAFGVMPIMVGHSDKAATYASAEQMFLAHVVHTLSPWYRRIEISANVNLLSEADQDAGFYTKFIPNALMRGAANDRANFYAKGLGSGGTKGWLTQNDVRAFEEMDRIDDPRADELPQPTAKAPADPTPPADPNGDPNAP